MVGGLGILLIVVMMVRHIGATIRENYIDNSLRDNAIKNQYNTYTSFSGSRNPHTNHRVKDINDKKMGAIQEDLQTGSQRYIAIDGEIAKMREAKQQYHEGTVWKGSIANKTVYIDYATEEIYQLVRLWQNGILKEAVWFYTDFLTNTQVIRKTDMQLKRDKELQETGKGQLVWSLDDIKNYHGDQRQDNGTWKDMWHPLGEKSKHEEDIKFTYDLENAKEREKKWHEIQMKKIEQMRNSIKAYN